MGWSGTIKEGYGKGTVQSIFDERVKVLKASDSKIEFVILSKNPPQRIMLMKDPSSPKEWLAYNYTPRKESPSYKDVPDYKVSYKSIDPDELEYTESNEEL